MTEPTAAPPARAAADGAHRPFRGTAVSPDQASTIAGSLSTAGGQRPAPRRPQRRFTPRRRVCQFCVDHIKTIDYKDVNRLKRYLSDRAKIEPRRKTGTCAGHQRALALALKRARHLALLPYTAGHIRQSGLVLRS